MTTKRTFEQWRTLYFQAPVKSDEALDLFQEMLIVAKSREEFLELTRIIWCDDLLPIEHPVVGMCTTGACFTIPSVTSGKSGWLIGLWNHIARWLNSFTRSLGSV